jgi:hypothetical protein
MTTFCRGSRGPGLTVNTYARGNTSTDLRLDVDLSGQSCAQQARMGKMIGRGMAMHEMIPRLDPPPGGRQMPGSGGGGVDSFYMSSSLELNAPIDLAQLAAHYAAQLERAGWTRDEEGQSGSVVWNIWSFRDEDNEPCRGFFYPEDAWSKGAIYAARAGQLGHRRGAIQRLVFAWSTHSPDISKSRVPRGCSPFAGCAGSPGPRCPHFSFSLLQ